MIHSSVLETIGNTPLVELGQVTKECHARVIAKLEYLNPGGSVKDRIGLAMVLAAEQAGEISRGDTIVEATAGNTGVALAMVAAVRGYHCVFVMPEKMSGAKAALLEAYGAEVIRTPDAPPSSPKNFRQVARRLAREKNWFLPDQFSHASNPQVHYDTTGPEIWRDAQGQVDALVVGVGTGGTLTGAGRYLKEQDPNRQGSVADPIGSTLGGGRDGPYRIEGIGGSEHPDNYDSNLVDEIYYVSDEDAFSCCHRLASEEGLLVGGASGCGAVAAMRWASKPSNQGKTAVVIFQDTGRNYLTLPT
ncbi:MAG TPA: cysteine synthase family protein [Myxococcales bacterium]|nr:cysteine synthase family protein [Myxococcales bacterium]